MKKKRLASVAAAAVACAALITFVVVNRSTHKRRRPTHGQVPLAAGGAAVEDVDASTDELVEDALRNRVRTYTFALERYDLRIADVEMRTTLDSVLERTDADFAVNGGFFDANGKALGLAISDGMIVSPLSKTMSGGVITFDGERARLFASEGFTTPEGTKFAIQCKPRLVVEGAPNVKSDDGQRSERSALCLRDGGKTMDVVIVREASGAATGPSLYALGRFLAKRGCENALNLDGGPSTGVAWRDDDGKALQFAPRRGVRHAVTFKRR
jgi:uncharacterized protein YigE (DUF2233 family)